jgi:hypothetical protein
MKKIFVSFLMGTSLLFLCGCAATQVAISKRNLDVQTKMSNTVFLNPVDGPQKTVYVQARNTSAVSAFNIDQELRTDLQGKGYRVVNNLRDAHYLVQINVLQVGKTDPTAAEKALEGGFGSASEGVIAGVATAGLLGRGGNNLVAGGLIGGAASLVANSLVKDVTYSVITDLQISERSGGKVHRTEASALQQGTSTTNFETSNSTSDWHRYQTRILSNAEKVNLDLNEALPQLTVALASSIAGMF